MSFTLYGDKLSGNCLKVAFVANYYDMDFKWQELSVVEGETRSQKITVLNPVQKVPFIQFEDGQILSESNAIISYLDELGGGKLTPNDPYKRAEMLKWMFWEQYSHETAIAVRRYQKFFLKLPEEEISPELLDKGYKALQIMEDELSKKLFMVGGAITLADVALVAYTRFAHEGGYDLSEYVAVKGWIARVESALSIDSA